MATKAGKLGALESKPQEKKVFFSPSATLQLQRNDLSLIWLKKGKAYPLTEAEAKRLVDAKRGTLVDAKKAEELNAASTKRVNAAAAPSNPRLDELKKLDATALKNLAKDLGATNADLKDKSKEELVALVAKLEAEEA